jgi:hypothetical protein
MIIVLLTKEICYEKASYEREKMPLNLTVIDDFLPKKEFSQIYNNISLLEWSHNSNYITDVNHIWYSSGPLSPQDFSLFKKALRKKLSKKIIHCELNSWTWVNTKEPRPHIDYRKGKCEQQLVFYIKSDEKINGGTGFYRQEEENSEEKDNYLDVHVGFKENRAVFFESKNCFHTPLLWNADNKTLGRYSAIFQLVVKDQNVD